MAAETLALGATIAAPLPSTSDAVDVHSATLGVAQTAPRGASVLPSVERSAGIVSLRPGAGPRYQPVRKLGEGGMGEVALVEDRDIGRVVARKRLLHGGNGGAVARFVDEVRIVGNLEHPNIVPIHDVGIDDRGELFFVMKYVEGETLESVIDALRRGDPQVTARWDFTRRIEVFMSLLRALQYAHGRGYLHRDVKPANVMVGVYGEVVLMDWGIARPIGGEREEGAAPSRGAEGGVSASARASSTHAGALIGTPLYMSPEQAAGATDTLDARSDLYSAAVVFHELLGLRHVHEGVSDLQSLLARVTVWEPESVHTIFAHASVPAELAHFVRRALQRRPEDRWQSAEEMLFELHAILDGRCRVQCPVTFTKRTLREVGRFADRRPTATIAIAVTALVVLSTLVALAIRGLLA